MKKIVCFLCAITLVLTSCSSDNDSSYKNFLLPKTEIYTFGSLPGDNTTVTYVYEGNKIVSLTYDEGAKTVFTYTGNLITKAIYTQNIEGEDQTTTTTLTYENNKLKSFLEVSSESESNKKRTYTYNPNGTISTVTVSIDPTTQEETLESSSILTLDSKGNIIKAESNSISNSVEYDNNNNPHKNILGYALLLDSDIFDKDANSVNNITKITERTDGNVTGTFEYENNYNSDNYLIKSVHGDETYEYVY
jgi:hypothetical protein